MGSPGSWVNKHGHKVGGGEWKDGIRLAQKLGFSFPKMAPHSIDTVLPAPQWPASLAHFITWCLMWDPKVRPTSREALEHEYFRDALDPLRPKSAVPRGLPRKGSTLGNAESADANQTLTTKTSLWFRKSLGARDNPPAVPEHMHTSQEHLPRPSPVHAHSVEPSANTNRNRPAATKRATWTNGTTPNAAPMQILPTIRPISPLSDASVAQASVTRTEQSDEKASKKIGRQLSVNSSGNHYADLHRQEAERALTGGNGLKSPTGSQRESFFSHLRKRARRLSGRHQVPQSPAMADAEANVGCTPWAGNRQSVLEPLPVAPAPAHPSSDPNFAELDRALQNVRYSLDVGASAINNHPKHPVKMASNPTLKRHHSLPYPKDDVPPQVPSATTKPARKSLRHPPTRYETPCEEDELLDEALASTHRAVKRLDNAPSSISVARQSARPPLGHVTSEPTFTVPYLTPSPSKDQMGVNFGSHDYTPSKAMDIPPMQAQPKAVVNSQWPTPPYDDNDWGAAAAASIFATQAAYR